MYERRYGLIRTLAPLHVGASAGEEAGNLNLIFRDAFTQTGIIPGSSIRGRFRAEMRRKDDDAQSLSNQFYGKAGEGPADIQESLIKFEHASIVWLPVYCPGQPIVWVSCPRLLKRYAATIGKPELLDKIPDTDTKSYCSPRLKAKTSKDGRKILFFNLGFMELWELNDLEALLPENAEKESTTQLVVVADSDIGMIHDMALYRQSRVRLEDNEKVASDGGFFNLEALPEGTLMVFPIAVRPPKASDPEPREWKPVDGVEGGNGEMYFGGLESIGFGRCEISIHKTTETSK
jgi:CRISPR-associated protein Cmr4